MYILNILAVLTLSSTRAFAAPQSSEYQDAITCGRNNPNANLAISIFCNRKNAQGQLTDNIVVPSGYALDGVSTNGWKVAIDGGLCKPAQWVPAQYCNSQFHSMCAESSGIRMYGYGKAMCQIWTISKS